MAEVELQKVVKRYGDLEVVQGIDLMIADNEFIVLVGPSGCGKSTTLRMIAGLESISGGWVRIGGKVINHVAPKDRNIAMVFQNYALYPHMTVAQNMGFSLEMQKMPRNQITGKVKDTAEILGLGGLLNRKPAALSGGQRQRVAMGRAIVRRPEVFLFDEPLSNLDAQLRTQMRMELKKLHLRLKTTTIYVTHDQVEAMTLADRIVILKAGSIQQVGTPVEVFEQPANACVARFIGNPPMNILQGVIQFADGRALVRAGDLALPVPPDKAALLSDGMKVMFGIRPDAIMAAEKAGELPQGWQLEGAVVVAETVGGQSLLEIEAGGHELIAELQGRVLPRPGEKMRFAFDLGRLHLFDPDTEKAIR